MSVKKQRRTLALIAAMAGLLGNGLAQATVIFGDGGVSLQSILDGITTAPVAGDSSVDVVNDQFINDDYWAITGGGAVSTIVIELAGAANSTSFGIFDRANRLNRVEIFDGPDSQGDQATIAIFADGSVTVNSIDSNMDFAANAFGFYLDHVSGLFYSDTSLNGDGVDHMAAYEGVGDTIQIPGLAPTTWAAAEFILAFEDLFGGGDTDYDDFVVLVNSIEAIPEPGVLALLGMGLLALSFARTRNPRAAR